MGNTFARWQGSQPELAAVGTGSHIDAIPNAGRFDGTVGVLGGLEAIRALQRAGFRPKRSIELVTFTSEEPTRFGIGCLGSRLLSGLLDSSAGSRLKDRDGISLDEARASAGFWSKFSYGRRNRENPPSFQAGNASVWPWLVHWSSRRMFCCSTNLFPRLIRSFANKYGLS